MRQVKLLSGFEMDGAYSLDGKLCAIEVRHLPLGNRLQILAIRRQIYAELIVELKNSELHNATIEIVFVIDNEITPDEKASLEDVIILGGMRIQTSIFRAQDLSNEFGVPIDY